MVSFLLDHNANVNQPDSEGWTPLHVAASCGHPEIAECVVHMSLHLEDFYCFVDTRVQNVVPKYFCS